MFSITEQLEQTKVTPDPLRKRFEAKLKEFSKNYPGQPLVGELSLYGAAAGTGENLTLWEIIKRQIEYRVEQHRLRGHPTTPEEFIDKLFELNPEGRITAEIIMGRLQVG